MRRLLAGLVLTLELVPWPAMAEDCRLIRIAEVDMTLDAGGEVIVPLTIAGQEFRMLVDTGGIFTMITDQSATRLGLKKYGTFELQLRMFGGTRITSYVRAKDLNFGGLKADHWDMSVYPGEFGGGIDGLIGPDMMRANDVDFDFANAKFSFFYPKHCKGQVVYWTTEPHAEVPFEIDDAGHIVAPIEIDGETIRALIDTGASYSSMRLESALSRFGLKKDDPRLKSTDGGRSYKFPFKEMTLEGLKITNPDIRLYPDEVSKLGPNGPPLILGMNVLRRLHLYIAYKEKKIYATAASAH